MTCEGIDVKVSYVVVDSMILRSANNLTGYECVLKIHCLYLIRTPDAAGFSC